MSRADVREARIAATIREQAESGLTLPPDLARERAIEALAESDHEFLDAASHGAKAHRSVRRDGKVRKGSHTQSRLRDRAMRKKGLKGIR